MDSTNADDGYQDALASYFREASGQKAAISDVPGKVGSPSASDSEPQRIGVLLDIYRQMLDVPLRKNKQSSNGTWRPNHRDVVVANPVDVISRTFGKSVGGKLHLKPEEWLLLFERGALAIADEGAAGSEELLGSEDIWAATIGSAQMDMAIHRPYSYLRRLGYIVVSPSARIHADSQDSSTRAGAEKGACAPMRNVFSMRPRWPWKTSPPPSSAYGDVFRRLLSRAPSPLSISDSVPALCHCDAYEVYRPNCQYKKRNPGAPHYRMATSPITSST
ncbi:hypothetical protein GQ54DRAFT_158458 [Martensiomyces pterosporus]|nr:hypothetical protein GQ54DRAFT_158458 [Martensiomyces pterosporus]